jgi:hypothetical protein
VKSVETDLVEEIARQTLADLCGLHPKVVRAALAHAGGSYTRIVRPKKDGGVRIINAPHKSLKMAQRKALAFLYHWETDPHLFAFMPGRSPVANARYHIWLNHFVPDWILRLDLRNAFPSVVDRSLQKMFNDLFSPAGLERFLADTEESQRTRELLEAAFWREETDGLAEAYHLQEAIYQEFIRLLVKLSTFEGQLPQGAPTSPYLLNLTLVWSRIIEKVAQLCQEHDFLFTVYSDDFTVSSLAAEIPRSFIRDLEKIICQGGQFKVNPQKTRLNHRRLQAHQITGVKLTYGPDGKPRLTLSQRKLNRRRGQIHRAAAMLRAGRLPDPVEDNMTISQVQGWISWILDVHRNGTIPTRIREPIAEFKEAWQEYKAKRGK